MTVVTAESGVAVGRSVWVIDLEPRLMVPVQAVWQRHTVSAVRDAVFASM